MSYQSDLTVVECDAYMTAKDVRKAIRLLENKDSYPESCFLDKIAATADEAIEEGLTGAIIIIPKEACFFSGNHVSDESLAIIAPLIHGTLSGYFVGEDGSLHGGFVIQGGALRKCKTQVTLSPIEP